MTTDHNPNKRYVITFDDVFNTDESAIPEINSDLLHLQRRIKEIEAENTKLRKVNEALKDSIRSLTQIL